MGPSSFSGYLAIGKLHSLGSICLILVCGTCNVAETCIVHAGSMAMGLVLRAALHATQRRVAVSSHTILQGAGRHITNGGETGRLLGAKT